MFMKLAQHNLKFRSNINEFFNIYISLGRKKSDLEYRNYRCMNIVERDVGAMKMYTMVHKCNDFLEPLIITCFANDIIRSIYDSQINLLNMGLTSHKYKDVNVLITKIKHF